MTRRLKVYYGSRSKPGHYPAYHRVPRIDLSGRWLNNLGFDIGDYISIECANGKIIIENLTGKEENIYA